MLGRRATPYALLGPALVFYALFFVTPMAYLLLTSFYTGNGLQPPLTLDNYARLFVDEYYRRILTDTLRIGLVVVALCLIVGYPVAYYMRFARGAERSYLTLLVLSPLLVSLLIRNFGWVIILSPAGLVNSVLRALHLTTEPVPLLFTELAVYLGLVHVFVPFMILAILSALHNVSPDLVRAAMNLGASPLRAFLLVTLPLSTPGMLAGSLIVFALTISSFVTPALLGGSRVVMLAQVAYENALLLFRWPLAAAVGFVLLVLTIAVVVVGNRVLSGRRFTPAAQ